MTDELCIVAVGARTPIGLTAESSAAAARGGITRVRLQRGPTGEDDCLLSADTLLPVLDTSGAQRTSTLGCWALSEVLRKLAVGRLPPGSTIPALIGLPEERPGCGRQEIGRIMEAFSALQTPGLRVAPEPVPLGHAAALTAIHHAHARLKSGRFPAVVVGGADSYIDTDTLDWLLENGQWQGEDIRGGFIPGEGAAFVALMLPEAARSAALPALARVRSGASAQETRLIKTDAVALGEGLGAAVAQAIEPLVAAGDRVEDVYCDINGERYRSEEWGFVALRLGVAFRDPTMYRTAVSSWGDVGAASGALNLVLCTQAWQRGYATGDNALVWGSSEGGLRSAVLLGRAPRAVRGA